MWTRQSPTGFDEEISPEKLNDTKLIPLVQAVTFIHTDKSFVNENLEHERFSSAPAIVQLSK